MRVTLIVITAAGIIAGACSSPVAPTSQSPAAPAAPAASAVTVAVSALDYSTHAPLPGITITLTGARSSSAVRTTNVDGDALLPALVGDSIIIDARSNAYAPMSAAAILSGPSEHWTFYLTRIN